MESVITGLVSRFGYWGVLLLIAVENIFPPIPSEVILTFGGFLTTCTEMTPPGIILFSTLGSVAGAIVLYGVGRLLAPQRLEALLSGIDQSSINQALAKEYSDHITDNERRLEQVLEFKARLYESLVGGMLTKEEYASYKAKYTKQAEDIRESIRVLKEKLTEVLENRSERNRWISQFTQFSTLETLDRRALIHMVQSIRVRGKKELDITFTHEDEYKKALQLLALAAQQKDYKQRKVG